MSSKIFGVKYFPYWHQTTKFLKRMHRCQLMVAMTYKYDVALSFAGENRNFAEAVARMLKSQDVEVFYDEFNIADLWGEDLPVKFREVYFFDSRYCLIILSNHYIEKVWPIQELRNAIEKSIKEKGGAYILPVRLDGFSNDVPGLPNTIGFITAGSNEPEKVVTYFLKKIRAVKSNRAIEINKTITIELIQEEVSKFFKLDIKDLKSNRRQRRISEPRQIAMFLSRKYTICSFPEIGDKFGGRNHSTVVHAVKNIKEKIKRDINISSIVSQLSEQLPPSRFVRDL